MEDSNGKNGRRWYDSSKMIWGLFAGIGTIILLMAGTIFAHLASLDNRLNMSDVERAKIEQKVENIDANVKEMKEDVKEIKNRRNP